MIYFIDYSNKHFLLRFRLLPINQSLFLEISVNQLRIKEHNVNIRNSFYNDPTDEGLFNRCDTTLISSVHLGFNEIVEFKRYIDSIEGITKTYNELKILLRQANITVHLDDYQLYGLQCFIKDLTERFVGYQMSLLEMVIKYKDEIVSQDDKIKIEPVRDLEPLKVEIPPVEIETPIDSNKYLHDLLQLSPNNLTTYYITKYLFHNVELEGNTIKIPNILKFGFQHNIELATIVNSITYNQSEISSRMTHLYNTIYNITITDPSLFESNKENIYLMLFLYYIYALKSISAAEAKVINYELGLKDSFITCLNYSFKSRMSNHPNNTEIVFTYYDEATAPVNYKNILDPLIKKHNYLITLDKNLFIEKVLSDLTTQSQDPQEIKDKPLLLNKPNILDVAFLMEQPKAYKSEDGFAHYINYQKDGITELYYIIQEILSGKILKNIPTLVSKHMQNITDNTFYNIDKNIESVTLEPVSTLILMNTYIEPFIKDTNLNKVIILFQVVVPYLYDKYKVTKFLNYYI
jgi:hypothetical protein